jgi:hypothetical protein
MHLFTNSNTMVAVLLLAMEQHTALQTTIPVADLVLVLAPCVASWLALLQ